MPLLNEQQFREQQEAEAGNVTAARDQMADAAMEIDRYYDALLNDVMPLAAAQEIEAPSATRRTRRLRNEATQARRLTL